MTGPLRGTTLVLIFVATFPAAAARAQADAKDWPMYNHDVLGSRYNRGETAIGRENAGRLEEKWRFPAKGSGQELGAIHATPVVVDGYVYFGTASATPTFYKLTPDGKVRWSYRNPEFGREPAQPEAGREDKVIRSVRLQLGSDGCVFGSALVNEDTVFFADLEGWIYALDRATGKERWKLSMRGKEFPGAHPLRPLLCLADPRRRQAHRRGRGARAGRCGASPAIKGCTGRGFVAALEPKTGHVVWKYDVESQAPSRLEPPITIKDLAPATTPFTTVRRRGSVWSTPSFDAESGTGLLRHRRQHRARRPTVADPPAAHARESCAVVIALGVGDGRERRWVTQINPGDVWTIAMRSYDPKEGRRHKDQSIGDTPKLYTIPVDGKPTRVVGVGCKDGGFYVLP